MSDATAPSPPSSGPLPRLTRLLTSRRFQKWAARFPLTRPFVRREGEALMDLMSGFVHSQVLCALVDLGILDGLQGGARSVTSLARTARVPEERLLILLRAGVSVRLLRTTRDREYALSPRGAAALSVPGLQEMILHNRILYADLADPGAFFRGDVDTELAGFWPYVFGAGAVQDPEIAARYSHLMADSQSLVAEETLNAVSLAGTRTLMDVGGGSGAFHAEALSVHQGLQGILFDLPAVAPSATRRFQSRGLAERTQVISGSFRDAPLPKGADVISLVRVLYDHADGTVLDLLRKVFEALPPNGRVIISEPMSGGARPDRFTDTYFALYTLAMGTGKTRSALQICDMLDQIGFVDARTHRTSRPFLTSVVSARRPRDPVSDLIDIK